MAMTGKGDAGNCCEMPGPATEQLRVLRQAAALIAMRSNGIGMQCVASRREGYEMRGLELHGKGEVKQGLATA